jgi:hypothetical protein
LEVAVLFSGTLLPTCDCFVFMFMVDHTQVEKPWFQRDLDTRERTQVQMWFRADWSDGAGGMGIWIYTNACFMDLLVWASKEKIPMLTLF